MPARDRYHDQVKSALIKEGWTITQDPLHVKWAKFLAVDEETNVSLFEDSIGKLLVDTHGIQLIVFDPDTETIRQWLPPNPIAN
ncbi:MAG: element excision factor XisH family protein [Isosphaeraceae bacterium]